MGNGKKLQELIQLLDLEQIEDNVFRAYHPEGRQGRLYGGQIMAQALMAGGRTVSEELRVHSLHGYFYGRGIRKCQRLFELSEPEMVVPSPRAGSW